MSSVKPSIDSSLTGPTATVNLSAPIGGLTVDTPDRAGADARAEAATGTIHSCPPWISSTVLAADPLVAALVRLVEALDGRYPDGPDQLRRELLDARANITQMPARRTDPAA